MFPGVNTTEIDEALKTRLNNKIDNVKPPLPQVIGTTMDLFGQTTIIFDHPIMLPKTMDQKYWDALLEV